MVMMVGPKARASRVYDLEPCDRTFFEDLAIHRRYGVVIDTPKVFVMGRPVRKDAPISLVLDPTYRFSDPDAWLVWLLAGDLQEALRLMPYPLPWLGWQRRNRLRWWGAVELAEAATSRQAAPLG